MSNDVITWPNIAAGDERRTALKDDGLPVRSRLREKSGSDHRLPPEFSRLLLQNVRRPLAALLDQALVSGASFATVVLVGRAAGDRELGLYALAATLTVLASGVQESLVVIPYTVFAPQVGEKRRRQFAASALAQSGLAGLALVGCLALAIVAIISPLPELAAVLAVLLIALPATLVRDFARRFAFASLRLDQALFIDGTVTAVQLALIAGLAWSGRLSALGGVAAGGTACGLVTIAWYLRCRERFAFGHGAHRDDWRKTWPLGSWLLAGHMAGVTQAYVLHWLLAAMLGVQATGAFAAAATLVALANPLIIGLGNFLMPATAHAYAAAGTAGARRIALRATAWLAAALTPFCLLAIMAGQRAMMLVYGEQFTGQAATLTLLALSASAAALGLGPEHALRSMHRPRPIFMANALGLVATLVMAAFLLPRYGTAGAAASLLAGHIVGCSFRWYVFLNALPRRGGTRE